MRAEVVHIAMHGPDEALRQLDARGLRNQLPVHLLACDQDPGGRVACGRDAGHVRAMRMRQVLVESFEEAPVIILPKLRHRAPHLLRREREVRCASTR